MSMTTSLDWFQKNASQFAGQLLWNEALSKHTYYRIGGPADLMLIPQGADDLRWIAQGLAAQNPTPRYWIAGLGSNVLVSDEGFRGIVIKCNRVDLGISFVDNLVPQIRVGASVPVSTLLRKAAQEGWGGLEFLAGVPGSMGGVVAMNAGTHLGEAKDQLLAVEYFGLARSQFFQVGHSHLSFEYRKNLFLPEDAVVTSSIWKIQFEEPGIVKARIDEILARRKNSQPVEFPSCGSVFKNPRASGLHAWQVIDRLQLRGHTIGGAQFSEKHCNFIINLGTAQASDVRALIELAKTRAQSELGILLEEEVKYVHS